MGKTKIEWATDTWNPITGCTKVSEGCRNCYAERMAKRQQAMGNYKDGFKLTLRPERLDHPLRWRKPRRIFVCSMADLFHEDVPFDYIAAVFGVMAASPKHTFQVLTKRPERMLEFFEWLDDQKDIVSGYPARARLCGDHAAKLIDRMFVVDIFTWPLPNVWLGVTAENQATWDWRVEALRQCPAAVRFVSVEPMVGPIDPCLFHWRKSIGWIICGGESGPGARSMHPNWVRSLRDQCAEAEVPFLFKQWGEWAPGDRHAQKSFRNGYKAPDGGQLPMPPGGQFCYGPEKLEELGCAWVERVGKKAAGRELDGVVHDGFPEVNR